MNEKTIDAIAGTFTAGGSMFTVFVVLWAYLHGNVARIHINLFGEAHVEALFIVPAIFVSSIYTYWKMVWRE